MMTRISVSVLSAFAATVFMADVSASRGESLRHGITTDRPAANWREAPPCGNGAVGAMPYGTPQDETILLNHEALFYPVWYTPKHEDVPNMAQYLPELRRLIAQGKYGEADGFWNSKLSEHNYALDRFPFTHPYHPVGDIAIQRKAYGKVRNYQQSLDFEKAEVVASWTQNDIQYERAVFVSRADDVVVVRLGSSKKNSITANISLTQHLPQEGILPQKYRGKMILPNDILPMFMGKAKDYLHAQKIYSDDPIAYSTDFSEEYYVFYGSYPDGRTFGAVAKVSIDGGQQRMEKASGKIEVVDASKVLVTAKVFANERDTAAVVKQLKGELTGLAHDYDKLLARHVALHRKLFTAMSLSLDSGGQRELSTSELQEIAKEGTMPNALVERLFDFGRYALICSSGELPANLQGVWSGTWIPCWSSDYTLNINVQMTYWPALPSNMPQVTMSYFDYFDSLMPDWKVNAKQFFGCRGMVAYMRCSDHGLYAQDAQWQFWTGGAGWLAQLYYDYYLFTGDKEFLRDRAVPFMKECALFYEDFVVMGDDGKYIFSPSHSPESVPAGGGHRTRTSFNATMDIAIAKEVFTNLIAACRTLGIEQDSIARWEDFIKKLPAYQFSGGALKEWITPKLKGHASHRHMSHIYPLLPGFEVYLDEGDPVVFEGCRAVLDDKLRGGAAGMGHSWAHLSSGFARLGDAEKALETLKGNALNCDSMNLFSLVPGELGTILIDGIGGFSSTVLEMLLYSQPGKLKVLPALPDSWPKGKADGMLARGGLTVDLQWDMQKRAVDMNITSKTAQTLELYFPAHVKRSKATNAKSRTSSRGLNYLDVTVPAGKEVTLHVELE